MSLTILTGTIFANIQTGLNSRLKSGYKELTVHVSNDEVMKCYAGKRKVVPREEMEEKAESYFYNEFLMYAAQDGLMAIPDESLQYALESEDNYMVALPPIIVRQIYLSPSLSNIPIVIFEDVPSFIESYNQLSDKTGCV